MGEKNIPTIMHTISQNNVFLIKYKMNNNGATIDHFNSARIINNTYTKGIDIT